MVITNIILINFILYLPKKCEYFDPLFKIDFRKKPSGSGELFLRIFIDHVII